MVKNKQPSISEIQKTQANTNKEIENSNNKIIIRKICAKIIIRISKKPFISLL